MTMDQLKISLVADYERALLEEKTTQAIERIRAYAPLCRDAEPLVCAFSGGKDSVVIYDLMKRSGIPFEAHYYVTSVDPPELVRFIKDYYPEVIFVKPRDKQGKQITMWTHIPKRGIPTRLQRSCCQVLKEQNENGRIVVTGVRAHESTRRYGQNTRYDNDSMRIVYVCSRDSKGVTLVQPIVDWYDAEIWAYIRENHSPYCKLYDEGYRRIGCVGCPMSTRKVQELQRYPAFTRAYFRSISKFISNKDDSWYDRCPNRGRDPHRWFAWWLEISTLEYDEKIRPLLINSSDEA